MGVQSQKPILYTNKCNLLHLAINRSGFASHNQPTHSCTHKPRDKALFKTSCNVPSSETARLKVPALLLGETFVSTKQWTSTRLYANLSLNGVVLSCTCLAKLWLSATSLRRSSAGVKKREKNGRVVPISCQVEDRRMKRSFSPEWCCLFVCFFYFLWGKYLPTNHTYKPYA